MTTTNTPIEQACRAVLEAFLAQLDDPESIDTEFLDENLANILRREKVERRVAALCESVRSAANLKPAQVRQLNLDSFIRDAARDALSSGHELACDVLRLLSRPLVEILYKEHKQGGLVGPEERVARDLEPTFAELLRQRLKESASNTVPGDVLSRFAEELVRILRAEGIPSAVSRQESDRCAQEAFAQLCKGTDQVLQEFISRATDACSWLPERQWLICVPLSHEFAALPLVTHLDNQAAIVNPAAEGGGVHGLRAGLSRLGVQFADSQNADLNGRLPGIVRWTGGHFPNRPQLVLRGSAGRHDGRDTRRLAGRYLPLLEACAGWANTNWLVNDKGFAQKNTAMMPDGSTMPEGLLRVPSIFVAFNREGGQCLAPEDLCIPAPASRESVVPFDAHYPWMLDGDRGGRLWQTAFERFETSKGRALSETGLTTLWQELAVPTLELWNARSGGQFLATDFASGMFRALRCFNLTRHGHFYGMPQLLLHSVMATETLTDPFPRTRLSVKNLDFAVNDAELWELFSARGNVKHACIRVDKWGRSQGRGLVEMRGEEDATAAVGKLNGTLHRGRALCVKYDSAGNKQRFATIVAEVMQDQGYDRLWANEDARRLYELRSEMTHSWRLKYDARDFNWCHCIYYNQGEIATQDGSVATYLGGEQELDLLLRYALQVFWRTLGALGYWALSLVRAGKAVTHQEFERQLNVAKQELRAAQQLAARPPNPLPVVPINFGDVPLQPASPRRAFLPKSISRGQEGK